MRTFANHGAVDRLLTPTSQYYKYFCESENYILKVSIL